MVLDVDWEAVLLYRILLEHCDKERTVRALGWFCPVIVNEDDYYSDLVDYTCDYCNLLEVLSLFMNSDLMYIEKPNAFTGDDGYDRLILKDKCIYNANKNLLLIKELLQEDHPQRKVIQSTFNHAYDCLENFCYLSQCIDAYEREYFNPKTRKKIPNRILIDLYEYFDYRRYFYGIRQLFEFKQSIVKVSELAFEILNFKNENHSKAA